jgi:hypothetical protein
MTVNIVNRMVVAFGIGAVALLGLSRPINAHLQPHQDQKGQAEQKEKKQPPAKKGAKQEEEKQAQQERIQQQEHRLVQYREHLTQQQHLAALQQEQLQQQHRTAQYQAQQQYVARVRQQQLRIESQGTYNYGRDPYFYTAPTFQYARGGRYYQTNQYGVDLLRQAVNYGYAEGRRAGLADRQDRWDGRSSTSSRFGSGNGPGRGGSRQ